LGKRDGARERDTQALSPTLSQRERANCVAWLPSILRKQKAKAGALA